MGGRPGPGACALDVTAASTPEPTPLSLKVLASGSPALAKALRGVERAAASDSPILIVGEPGTGRSAVARAIHGASSSAQGPLVEVDPATVPNTLFESDLFGHAAGAFTGADRARPGKVARADGGTLVLDHIEELPVSTQPKLLRLLAEGRFAPLGGPEVEARVRFVAISTEDLPERIEKGLFRADLFYRLEVLSFRLPPLRERRQDLAALVEHFLQDLRGRFGREPLELSERARGWMSDYDWPGNLRELRNVLERELVSSDGDTLDPEAPIEAGRRPESLKELEKAHIRRTLAYTRGHQGEAARILGISRKALWEKRRRYGLP